MQHVSRHENDGGESEYTQLKLEIKFENNFDLNGESAASFLKSNNLSTTQGIFLHQNSKNSRSPYWSSRSTILEPRAMQEKTFEFQPLQDFQPVFSEIQNEIQQNKLETTTEPKIEEHDTTIENTFYVSLLISLGAIGLYFRYEKSALVPATL